MNVPFKIVSHFVKMCAELGHYLPGCRFLQKRFLLETDASSNKGKPCVDNTGILLATSQLSLVLDLYLPAVLQQVILSFVLTHEFYID